MANCIKCSNKFGFLELTKGLCNRCLNEGRCNKCGKELDEGFDEECCESCNINSQEELKRKLEIKEEEAVELEKLNSIILTTEDSPRIEILERIEIITAECAFGMNLFKDFFAGVRDIVGGRSKATQNILRDARKTVLEELKKEAYSVGANAVIGVDLDYSEFSGGGKSMLFVVASGTAVKTGKSL